MREELAAVHRALRHIIMCLTRQSGCCSGLPVAWPQVAECFTWNQDNREKD
jgi:hypothetical protein